LFDVILQIENVGFNLAALMWTSCGLYFYKERLLQMKNHYIGQEAYFFDQTALGPMSHSSFSRYSPWASYISLFSNKSHIFLAKESFII